MQALELMEGDAEGAKWAKRVAALERHVRENKLRLTLADELGRAPDAVDEVTTGLAARRLAFYLFWNVRACHDRCARSTHVTGADGEV